MNGLFPLPQVDMRFSSQAQYPVNGNNLVHSVYGSNYIKQHRFCVSYTRMVTPPNTKHLKFKVDRFFKHVVMISMEYWLLGM